MGPSATQPLGCVLAAGWWAGVSNVVWGDGAVLECVLGCQNFGVS